MLSQVGPWVAVGEQLRKGVGVNQIPREHEPLELPPYFDDFQDYKAFCVNYRGDLARIVKLTSGLLPEQALAAASRRLQNALQQCSSSSSPPVVINLDLHLSQNWH